MEFLQLTKESIDPSLRMYLQTQSELIFETPMEEALHDIEFLDLPGLMGSGPRLDRVSASGTQGSDGVIYVVNAQQGLTRTDIEFIETVIPRDMPIMIVITHLDLKPPSERMAIAQAIHSVSKGLTANITGVVETRDSCGTLTTHCYRILFRDFMPKMDGVATLKRILRDTLHSFDNLIRELDEIRQCEDPFPYQILSECDRILSDLGVCFGRQYYVLPILDRENVSDARLSLHYGEPKSSNMARRSVQQERQKLEWQIYFEDVYQRVCLARQPHQSIGKPEKSSSGKSTKDRKKIKLFIEKRSLKIYYIVGTARQMYAGPYLDAFDPILSVARNRWAVAVRVEEGWKIMAGEVRKPPASNDDSQLRTSEVFEIVSQPWFLANGNILFAGARNGVVTIENLRWRPCFKNTRCMSRR